MPNRNCGHISATHSGAARIHKLSNNLARNKLPVTSEPTDGDVTNLLLVKQEVGHFKLKKEQLLLQLWSNHHKI